MDGSAPWQHVQMKVREAGAVAAVAASPESVRHLAGVFFPSQVMIRRRFAFVVVPGEGEPTLIVQAVLEHTARSQGALPQVVTFVTGPTDVLIRFLTEQRLDQGVVLVELDFLPAVDASAMERGLRDARIEDGSSLFAQARRTRSPRELEEHRRYTRAAERAIHVAFSLARGVTERQVHARMQDAMLSLADGTIPFLTLASGPERTMLVHALPEDRVIRSGDLLRVDAVGFFGGIYTDMARTVVVGEASAEQRAIYRRVRAVQREVIDGLRPGLTAGEVYDDFTKSARRHGLGFTYRYVGHSTGYQVVEDPVLTTGTMERLQAGMVLCVEVMDLVEGVGGVHIEDVLLLTEDGAKVWTTLMASDEIPEIR